MKRILLAIILSALNGCSVFYTYDGKRYESKEAFHHAVDATVSGALVSISPLPGPITKKALIVGVPSESAILEETVRRFVTANGRQPADTQNDMLYNLSKATYKNLKVYHDAILRRNIYESVKLVELQSLNSSLAASKDSDVLYMVEPSPGGGQWFYASDKHGRQVFASDRSGLNPASRVQSFVDAVQLMAIRD